MSYKVTSQRFGEGSNVQKLRWLKSNVASPAKSLYHSTDRTTVDLFRHVSRNSQFRI